MKCETCSKTFVSFFRLFEHQNIHTGETPFLCPLCSESFQLTRDYVVHYEQNHLFVCDSCKKSFDSESQLKVHSLSCCSAECTDNQENEETREPCDISRCDPKEKQKCLKKVPKESEASSEKVRNILCSCERIFQDLKEFKIHVGPIPHSCCSCKMQFSTMVNLIKHIRSHTKERPFVCPHCQRAFSQATNLRNHMFIHKGDVKCQLCPFSCRTPVGLFKHMRKHETGAPLEDGRKYSPETFKCDDCGKEFRFLRNLRMHCKRHTNNPQLCVVCGLTFRIRAELNKHALTHQISHCSVCTKVFKGVPALRAHMRIHTVGKKHACPVCGKFFKLASYLRNHVAIHKSEPNFSCQVCEKKFKSKKGYVIHMAGTCPRSSSQKPKNHTWVTS